MKENGKKIFFFSLGIFLLSLIFWWTVSLTYREVNGHTLSIVALFLIIYLSFWGLYFFIIRDKLVNSFAIILSGATFFIFFPFNVYYLLGLSLLIFSLFISRSKILRESNLRIKISVVKILRPGIVFLTLFLFIHLSLISYFNPLLQQIKTEEINFPRSWFKIIEKPLNSLFESLFSPFELEMIKKGNSFGNLNINHLYLDSNTQQKISSELIYQILNQRLKKVVEPYQKYIPLVASVAVFLVLQALLFIIRPLTLFFAQFIFLIFYWTKFVKIKKESREVEVLTL